MSIQSRIAPLLCSVLFAGPAAAQTPAAAAPRPPADACLAPSTWYSLAGGRPQSAPAPQVLREIARRDVVLLGEQHDNADHHRWQLQTLAALHLLRPNMVIGFETFPRRVQPALDRWVAGEVGVKEFLALADWERVWSMPAALYLPLFEFARLNRIPMIALNVERKLTQAVTAKGWDAVPVEQREGLARPAPASPAYREYLFAVYREHPTVANKDTQAASPADTAFGFFVESQTTWDRAMAEALARELRQAAVQPLVIGIMGAGHVQYGYGVPHQLRDMGITNVGTLLPVDAREDCRELKGNLADAVFAMPGVPPAPPAPPRLGVQLAQAEGSVTISGVTAGSLAEQTGLKPGDRIVTVAGVPVSRTSSAISAVRLQPPGTWLPMQIERGAEILEIIVKFPPLQ